jgi:hypothetical protein
VGSSNPLTSESGLGDEEFGFAETTRRHGSRGVRNLLNATHTGDPVVDRGKESVVASSNVAVNDVLGHQGTVSDPHVQIVRVGCCTGKKTC